jgi:DNA-binding CsgD family transcriptional regulator
MARAADQPAWDHTDRERIRKILPYVRESVQVHKQLDRNRYISGLARDLLNKSPRGVLVLSGDGKIQMANTRATAILAAHDGLSDRDGKLVIQGKDVAKRLSDYLGKLDTMGDAGLPEMDWNMVVNKPSGGAPYQLILGHLTLSDWNLESRHSDKVAVIHVHDPNETVGVQPEQLSDFYGFTKAQARLAAKLFQGYTINEAADALHISVNTARTHMRGIYAKTGVRTQAELLGVLSTGLTSYGKSVSNS